MIHELRETQNSDSRFQVAKTRLAGVHTYVQTSACVRIVTVGAIEGCLTFTSRFIYSSAQI